MKIWYVPIEPLEERYTASWYRNIPAYFTSRGAEVKVIDGSVLRAVVETGTFLDINSTIHYKASQMGQIAALFAGKQINDGDIFFFGDVEFWGLEGLRLMSQINRVNIRIAGVLHAASYSIEDTFAVAESYQKYTELGWLAAVDTVFVGSYYHKDAVIKRRILPYAHKDQCEALEDKIVVTGLPLFADDYEGTEVPWEEKQNQIIIAGRLDWERRPNISLDMAYLLKKELQDAVKIIVTVPSAGRRSNRQWLTDYAAALAFDGVTDLYYGLSKKDYHAILSRSKVFLSNTVEENFGYACMEACIYGCCPIVKKAYSYPELLQGQQVLLFNTEDEIVPKVLSVLKMGEPPCDTQSYARRYFESMNRMWEALR